VTELRTISWTDTSAEGPRQLSRRIVGAESFKINSDGTVWLNLCIPKLNQHSVRLLLDAVATTSGPGITSYTGSSPALLAPNGTLISVSGHGSAASGGDEQIWARMSEQLVVAPTGYSNGSKDTSKGARPLCVLGGTTDLRYFFLRLHTNSKKKKKKRTAGGRCGAYKPATSFHDSPASRAGLQIC